MIISCLLIISIHSFMELTVIGQGNTPNLSNKIIQCSKVLKHCQDSEHKNVPRCLEQNMRNCTRGSARKFDTDFYQETANSLSMTRVVTHYGHIIQIPSEAVLSITGKQLEETNVALFISILNNNLFEAPSDKRPVHENVLGVWLGDKDVQNLSHPVEMMFVNNNETESGECVYWKLSKNNDKGDWSTDGCTTEKKEKFFVCSCTHLSFFAVLISPDKVQNPADVLRLKYITYIGSSCSVAFTVITIVMFLSLRKMKTEHSVIIHIELTSSLLLLHLFFLVNTLGSESMQSLCQFLGIVLHWSLLATFTWMAIEGFHLYLLLVRVFNIYISKYLLKLSLVGWGVPSIAMLICGVTGNYKTYPLIANGNNTSNLCWLTDGILKYISVNAYLALVLLFNATILVIICMKMRKLKLRGVQNQKKARRMWKDCASLLGLSCILGLPWGLAFISYGPMSLAGIYLFTIINSFQGFLTFLWFLSLTCKSVHEKHKESSSKDLSMTNFSSDAGI